MKNRGATLIEVMTIVAIVAIIFVALFGRLACTDQPGATSALHGMGFKDVQLRRPELWSACGKEDTVNHPFTAKNTSGQTVSGTVCCGGPLSFKGCTVRF